MIKCNLRALLAQRGMTQLQLSKVAEIRQPTVSALCVDREGFQVKQVPVDLMNKLCRALDCQPGDLFTYIPSDDKKPQA